MLDSGFECHRSLSVLKQTVSSHLQRYLSIDQIELFHVWSRRKIDGFEINEFIVGTSSACKTADEILFLDQTTHIFSFNVNLYSTPCREICLHLARQDEMTSTLQTIPEQNNHIAVRGSPALQCQCLPTSLAFTLWCKYKHFRLRPIK
jgi:hypothetical protein